MGLGHNLSWEIAFFNALPKLLEPINQTAWDLNVAMRPELHVVVYVPGPLVAGIAAGVLCGFAGAVVALRRYGERHRLRGFEVVMEER